MTQHPNSHHTQRQLQTLKDIAAERLPLLLLGGFAEDAWLYGECAREHGDLDYLTHRSNLPLIFEAFQKLGLEFEQNENSDRDRPSKYVYRRGSVTVDIGVMDTDENGQAYIDLRNSDGTKYRLELPDALLEYPKQQIDDVIVTTVSPAFQVMGRRFFAQTNRLPWREKDTTYQQKLLERFPESDVQPQFKVVQE